MRKEDGPKPRHVVYLLVWAGEVLYVDVGRQDRPAAWQLVYQYRDQLPGKLAARFRTMPGPPDELVIIGRAAGLHKRTAQGIVRMVERWFPAAIRRTKPYGPRAVGMVEAGRLTVWPSCAAAARHFHTRRQGIFAMVEAGRLFWAN